MRRLILGTTIAILLSPSIAYTHPGKTASDGCHYCRTNCDKWGVPWNVRHCHGRMQEPFSVKIKDIVEENKFKANEEKEPGWEYYYRVQKTGNRTTKTVPAQKNSELD